MIKPVKWWNIPGKSALMNFLSIIAMLPFNNECRSLTINTMQVHNISKEMINKTPPRRSSLQVLEIFSNKKLPEI